MPFFINQTLGIKSISARVYRDASKCSCITCYTCNISGYGGFPLVAAYPQKRIKKKKHRWYIVIHLCGFYESGIINFLKGVFPYEFS